MTRLQASRAVAEELLGWRRSNVGHLLNAASDRFVLAKVLFLRAHGFAAVTDAQLGLLLHIRREGSRPSDLATLTGVGKSSITELVNRVARAGLVTRRGGTLDMRYAIVEPTHLGASAIGCLERALASEQRRILDLLGEDATMHLRNVLASWLYQSSGVIPQGVAAMPVADESRQTNLGRLLALSSKRFVLEVLSKVRDNERRDVGEALLTLFRHLELDGSRLTELALRARVTKQSMRQTILKAEKLELVELGPDREDARARRVRFSARGLALLTEVGHAVAATEDEMATNIGPAELHSMKVSLGQYVDLPDCHASGAP